MGTFIALVLIVLASISEAVMDCLQFHYGTSKFVRYKKKFWNPGLSWMNKYKLDLRTPKFFGSTTIFVFTTDAWHLFKFFRNSCLFFGLCILGFNCISIIQLLIAVILCRIIYGFFFTLFYRYFSNKSIY